MTKTHAGGCNRCGVRLAADNHDGRCAPCLAAALVGPATPSLPTSDLAAAMLGPPALATDPAPVADLVKQVTTAWRLRQRASYDVLGQLLPLLLTQAETRAVAGSDEAEQA